MLLEKKKYLLKNSGNLRSFVSDLPVTQLWTDNTEKLLLEFDAANLSRQQLSRKIGALKKESQPVDAELQEMQELSQQAKQLENSIEEALAEGDKLLATQADPSADSAAGPDSALKLPAFMQPASSVQSVSGQDDKANTTNKANTKNLTISADFKDSEWTDYVSTHEQRHIYHDLRWRGVIESSFSQKTHYLIAKNQTNRVVGVLPLAQLQSALFGKFLISLPYFNYGGPLAENDAVASQLVQAAGKLSAERELAYLELREVADREPLPSKTHKVSMLLKLPQSSEELMSGLGAKLRSQAKRAEKAGAVAKIGGIELLDTFYHVFCRNMRDLGTPVYSKNFFRNILEAFPEQTCLHVVEIEGQPAAAGFLVAHRDTVEIPWASSLRRYNNLSVNMMLYRSVLEWSIDQGFDFFDFGRSSVDGPTYRFKQQWGSQPVQLHWNYYLEGSQTLPSLSPDNPKFALFIAIWKRLPVFVSNAIGPHLVRNLP